MTGILPSSLPPCHHMSSLRSSTWIYFVFLVAVAWSRLYYLLQDTVKYNWKKCDPLWSVLNKTQIQTDVYRNHPVHNLTLVFYLLHPGKKIISNIPLDFKVKISADFKLYAIESDLSKIRYSCFSQTASSLPSVSSFINLFPVAFLLSFYFVHPAHLFIRTLVYSRIVFNRNRSFVFFSNYKFLREI